jgi:RNA polymerase sigma-70 factor (ECF subfamily)
MAEYASGDPTAFKRLFDLLAPKIRAFFLHSFPDRAIADDLTQATFLKLHRARATYRADRPLKPWVFTIAAGVRRDELRRRYRLPPLDDADLEHMESAMIAAGELGVPASSAAASDDLDEVRAAVARLPDSQRVVVHLHRYEELTFEQIAEVLSTTPGAVRVRASRAYERLREELRPLLKARHAK